ncbi:MAG: thioredoxin family protein [Candidatus Zixiibacteriota bacterium]
MFRFAKYAATVAAVLVLIAVSVRSDNTAKPAAVPAEEKASLVGQKAPDFSLKDTDGKLHTLRQYLDSGKTVVIQWFNPNCPFVIRHFETYPTFTDLYTAYNKKNVVVLAINSTNPKHPQFGNNVEMKKKWGIQYPILLDEDGVVGKLYDAKTTPHTFVISPDGFVRYSGAIDDDPQDAKAAKDKINYARQALDELLAGKPVSVPETRPYGCGVKYAQ